ncbi:MAG: hypothetical protein AAB850_02385 [Patescibacteria group bacterium]
MPSVKVFTTSFDGDRRDDEQKANAIAENVNAALKENPDASVQWLQSSNSSASSTGSSFLGAEHTAVKHTTLTAIVSIPG